MPEHKMIKTWTCPVCGKAYERREDEKRKTCSCGHLMEATIDIKDGGALVMRRLED